MTDQEDLQKTAEDLLKRIAAGEDVFDALRALLISDDNLKGATERMKTLLTNRGVVLDGNSVRAFHVGTHFGELGKEQDLTTQTISKIIIRNLLKEYGVDD